MKKIYRYILFLLSLLAIRWLISSLTGQDFEWWITLGIGLGSILAFHFIEKTT